MTQPSQTDSSEAPISANEFPAFAHASEDSVALGSNGKEAGSAGLSEPRNSLDQNAEHETEHLLEFIASLESCNTALLNKLNQAQEELVALRRLPVQTLPKTESTDGQKQSFGWERKLTRTQWRPT